MTKRVKQYEGTAYYTGTGSSHTKLYPFTEEHAVEAGVAFDADGIDIEAAKRLLQKWGRRGKGDSIRYSYRLPLEITS